MCDVFVRPTTVSLRGKAVLNTTARSALVLCVPR